MEQGNNLTRAEAAGRASILSDLQYEISFDLSETEPDTYACQTVLRFKCAAPGSETFLDYLGASVESLELNGRALDTGLFTGARIWIPDLEEENELRIVSRSRFEHTGVGLHRFRDPVDDRTYLYTDFEPFDAHRVYPCFDQPDLKGEFTFSVLAPGEWEVISNNPSVGSPADSSGLRRWTFAPTPPISTYVTCLVAGPYHSVRDRHDRIDLGLYCRQSLARYLEPEELFEITKQGFDFFEKAFDYPYPFQKYDQLMVPEFNSGAMENAGCITFNESYLFRSKVTEAARERRAETILHEMAHMWFGDLVTMKWWDDLWLNESFASFVSVLAMVRATRFEHAWTTFADEEKTWAYRQDQLPSTHPITADMPDTNSIRNNFDGITYAKGASVLRQLVAWVGEEAFLAGLRIYFRRHEFGNTDLSGFLSALEAASERDLRAWSKEWLETAGVNTLRAELETVGTGDEERIASTTIAQSAPPEHPVLRSHRLGVGLYDLKEEGLVRRRLVELDVVGATTLVPQLDRVLAPDLLLLNDEDLAYTKIRLDPRSLRTVTEGLSRLESSLARAVVWGACWDMVRDAEFATRDYLRLVLGNAEAEPEVGVVQRLLGHLVTAVNLYGEPANREPALATVARTAREALGRAESGGDHQLAWARAFMGAATEDGQVAEVQALLSGDQKIEGLAMDVDLRWHSVGSLAAAGAAGEDAIAAELERDPTDLGRRYAAGARSARPVHEAKSEAWAAITGDTTLSRAMLTALMRGFQQPGQRELLEPYGPRYFEALEPIWEEREFDVALAFAEGMYPRYLVEEETIRMTDDHLSSHPVPPPIRRILIEGRDEIARAMRAREIDRAAG